jgi:heme-degrading monooxygenase HmoA
MYGTIARFRVKPGMEERAQASMHQYDDVQIPGSVANYMYRMDADSNEYYLVVIFESKEAYMANANSPDQNARYQDMLTFIEGPPEWHDGEVVHAQTYSS